MKQLSEFLERLDQDIELRQGFEAASGSGTLHAYLLDQGFPLVATVIQQQHHSSGLPLSSFELDTMIGQDWQSMETTSTGNCNARTQCGSTCGAGCYPPSVNPEIGLDGF